LNDCRFAKLHANRQVPRGSIHGHNRVSLGDQLSKIERDKYLAPLVAHPHDEQASSSVDFGAMSGRDENCTRLRALFPDLSVLTISGRRIRMQCLTRRKTVVTLAIVQLRGGSKKCAMEYLR
jgi:hypothetical protein